VTVAAHVLESDVLSRPGMMRPQSDRLFFLDACRAGFMLLGIVLHATVPFMPNMPWYISAPDQNIVLAYLYHFIHAFRMPGFFMMAGFFAALILTKRSSGTWFRGRLERLGIPLLFGIILVVPFESLALALPRQLSNDSFNIKALFGDAIQRHARLGIHLMSHLWFILDLLLISAAFAAIWPKTRVPVLALCRHAIDILHARPVMAGSFGLLIFAAYLLAIEVLAYSRAGAYMFVGGEPMWGVIDICRILHYAPFFALGVVLCEDRTFMMWFIKPSTLAWIAGLASVVALTFLHVYLPQYGRLGAAFEAIAGVLLVRICLQLAFKFLNKQNWLVQQGVASSYTIYIVHGPILVLAAVLSIWLGAGAFLGFFLVLISTAVLSVAVYQLTRDVPLATYVLNGVRPSGKTVGNRVPVR
jgi:glucans biosynthesis protein C